jgi:intracellular septation protein A
MTHNRKHTPHFKLFEHSEFLKWGVYIVSIVRHLDFTERNYFFEKDYIQNFLRQSLRTALY